MAINWENSQHSDKIYGMMEAIFKTSAEVISGLMKTIEDYESKSEKAWQ